MKRSLTPLAVAVTACIAFPVASTAAGLVLDIPQSLDINQSLPQFSNVLVSSPAQTALMSTVLQEGLVPPGVELEQLRVVEGLWGDTHVRYRMKVNGYPIFGTKAIAHLASDGTLVSMTQQAMDPTGLPTVALITAEAARTTAVTYKTWQYNPRYVVEAAALCYLYTPETGELAFTYRVVVTADEGNLSSRGEFYINALTGAIIVRYEHSRGALTRGIFIPWHIGPYRPVKSEGAGPVGDDSYDWSYNFVGDSYYYFFDKYGRDSFDDLGQAIGVFIKGEGNHSQAGVWWSPHWLYLGRTAAVDPDTVYHEYAHLVTMHTSDFTPSGQSGVLDEAMSDIWAAAISAHTLGVVNVETWKISNGFSPYPNPVYVRRMDAPSLIASQPDHMSEYNPSASSHFNSNIVSHAFYLLSQGGQQASGNSTITVHGLGIDTAGAIFYSASDAYFHPGTTLAEAAAGTAQSATNVGRRATASTVSAWYAVGVIPTPWGYDNEGWKVSFTGWTYFDTANYVYSYDYGWAWWGGYDSATGGIDMWLDAKGKWIYTSAEMYPWFYDHASLSWKENHSGAFD